MQQKLIAFIGGGNMSQAIVLGLLKQGYPADKIIVNDPNEEKRAFFAQYGVAVSTDNEQSITCLLYTSPSPRDVEESRMPSSA